MKTQYKAYVAEYISETQVKGSIKTLDINDLPKNEVLIEVYYSALNYKDTLSAKGHKGITRNYPHTPGIDAAGVVAESSNPMFAKGDQVLVTGYDLGMNTSGGFSEYIRVPAEWVVRLPKGVSFKEAMIFGTAGFTAATAILEFRENNIFPEAGKVLVNGATGGVGTMAIAMLAQLGYKVTAATGKLEQTELLKLMGAYEVIHRSEIFDKTGKPLLAKKWVAALDNVGGNTLSTVLRSISDHGVVCNCGMVESVDFSVTVFPFILRAIRLIGIASADTPRARRLEIWDKIFGEYKLDSYKFPIKEVSLENLNHEIELMSAGEQIGRVLVKVRD